MAAAQAPAVAGQVANAMSSVVQSRQGSLSGLNSGDPVFTDRNLWVKPFANFMDQEDNDGAYGFSAKAYGMGMGVDGEVASGDRLGISLFYTRARADTNNVEQDTDMDVVNLMVYGSRPLAKEKNLTFFWQFGGGIQDTESSRYLSGITSKAKADYTGTDLFAQVRAVQAFKIKENLILTGGASVSYTWIYTPS